MLFGVRKCNGWKCRIGLLLRCDHEGLGQPRLLERTQQGGSPNAVHGGVCDANTIDVGTKPKARYRCEIASLCRAIEALDQRMVDSRQLDRARIEQIDARGDGCVMRRHNLCAVAKVDLVSVVDRRVVAGGDDHTGNCVVLGDVPCEHRSWQWRRQQQCANACGCNDARRVEREIVALATCIESDDDASLSGIGPRVDDMAGQPSGGLAHHKTVHTKWTSTNRTA